MIEEHFVINETKIHDIAFVELCSKFMFNHYQAAGKNFDKLV